MSPGTLTDNIGIGTASPAHQLQVGSGQAVPDAQAMQLRVVGDEPEFWKGGAAFGHDSAAVIMGELGGVANIGGHTGTISDWADLAINKGGGNVGIGQSQEAKAFHLFRGIAGENDKPGCRYNKQR